MRKSFMKKLFATLAVAMVATVGAGVALAKTPEKASAATMVINSCANTTDAVTIDTSTPAKTVNGVTSTNWKSEGDTSLYLTSATQWFNVNLSVGTYSYEQLQSYTSISFDVYAEQQLNWHIADTLVGSSTAGAAKTITFPISTLTANQDAYISGSPNYIKFVVQATNTSAEFYIDNVTLTGSDNSGTTTTTDWTITNNAGVTADNGTYSFVTDAVTDGAAVVSNTSFTNFQLEYDMTATAGSWLPIAFFGATESNMYYHNKFLYVNDWGAVMQLNFVGTEATQIAELNTAGVSPYTNRVANGQKIHVKLVVNSGNVVLTITKDSSTYNQTLYTDVNVTGKVGIPSTINSNFTISNLSVSEISTSEPTIPSAPATTVNGTLLNNCEGEAAYWLNTNGTRESSTEVKSQGTGSYKLTLNNSRYFTPLLVDYSAGAATLTEEQFLAYDGLYLEVYNPGSAVDLYLYNTFGATVQSGWNQITIPMETIEEQLAESKADREESGGGALQFEGGLFFFVVYEDNTVLYIDNIMGINPASGGEGGDTPTTPTTPGLLQSFESVKIKTGVTGVANVSVSTQHVTQGMYSNALKTNAQWFELHITLDNLNMTGYNAVAFDFYSESGTLALLSYGGVEHTEYAGQSGTWILDAVTFNGMLSGDTFTVTCMTDSAGTTIYFDNLRAVLVDDGSDDTNSTTVYTQFSNPLIKGWELTNLSSMMVTEGVLQFENNGTLVSTNEYDNFILEYDLKVPSRTTSAWIPLASIGITDTSNFAVDLQKSIVINQWGAVAGYNLGFEPYTSGLFEESDTSVPATHVKIVAQDGQIDLTLIIDGEIVTKTLCTGVDTKGKIAITACDGSTLHIDNLVLINSNEFADYEVKKITLAGSALECNANSTQTGNLFTLVQENAAANGIDLTNKAFTFDTLTEGFYVHGKTGAWEYLAPEMDGTYTLNYLITVNDLVLGGWVYPLGDKGVYTIECSIVVSVKNGIPATGGGGAGDTSQLPEVVGENSIEHLAGEVQEESFIIDTKGNEIISVKLGSENVKLEAYALADVDGGKKITFKADFMALLSVGDKEFIISTEKGSVSVYVIVFESVEPTIEGENTVSMDKNDEKDAQFNLDTGKLAITMILRSGLKALNGDAYTYQDGVLTIKKEYLATLSPELYEFYVYTKGGYTTVKVEIKESLPPMAEETLKNYALGSLQDVEFTLYTFELDILQILRNGAEKALNSDAYTFTFDAESGLLTFKGEYLSTLGQGACTFTVSTAGGDVELTINISGNAPTCSENQKAAKYGEATDVSFNVNTKGLDVIAIQRKGADYGLNNSAYTFENNKLTLLGKYVALLELGKHEFVLETEGGTVSLYLDIKEEFEPDVEKPDDPEKPDEPEIPDNPDNPESPDNPDGREDFEEDENPFEEDINSPSDDGDDNPSQPDTNPEDQKPSGDGSSYEEVFTGIVKPDEEAYNKYLEGLESGGQVSSGCDSSLSVMAGLPIVGVIAWFIRKKKEN